MPTALAVDQLRVLALFSGKAMVSVDGTRRLLKVGERSPEGLLLISADSREAIIEFEGRRESYPLGSHIQGSFSAPNSAEAKIWRDPRGSFKTVGSINGQVVSMVIDTGATSIAMNSSQAKRLGLQYRLNGQRIWVTTASGRTQGHAVKLDRVRVGDIEFRNVGAVVIEGEFPTEVLLGMTFLKRVKMEDQGKVMILRTKY